MMENQNFAVIILSLTSIIFVSSRAAFLTKSVSGGQCLANEYGAYRLVLQFCDGKNWRITKAGTTKSNSEVSGSSCLDIKTNGFNHGDGKYMIDPDGDGYGEAFEVYCDMTSFGGGWTMCYTTDSHVDIRAELQTTPALGYRADCRNIPYTDVLFVDEKSKEKAMFNKSGPPITFTSNYDKMANAFGIWTPHGVATTQYQYQMLICDTSFYKGLHFSGYTDRCYKQCDNWCSDSKSSYFRTATVSDQRFTGVAFNENGLGVKPKRLISAGIR